MDILDDTQHDTCSVGYPEMILGRYLWPSALVAWHLSCRLVVQHRACPWYR
jgi:hypothetical protein